MRRFRQHGGRAWFTIVPGFRMAHGPPNRQNQIDFTVSLKNASSSLAHERSTEAAPARKIGDAGT
jgi:hypothetical protein